jgi:hypothetical protein
MSHLEVPAYVKNDRILRLPTTPEGSDFSPDLPFPDSPARYAPVIDSIIDVDDGDDRS